MGVQGDNSSWQGRGGQRHHWGVGQSHTSGAAGEAGKTQHSQRPT